MREWLIDLEIKQIKEFIQKMFKHYIQELFKHIKTKTPSKRSKKAGTGLPGYRATRHPGV
tara:strand:- start:2670 stop:2849 length:180 start_codon:yes stop_codon:yes gene_type:complete